MSICLAIETATDSASVALGCGTDVLAEIVVGRRRAAAALVPAIESCLQLASANWKDISHLAVADGPGSFTGLRIGFATAQGIVTERECTVSVTPSLMAAAWGAAQSEMLIASLYDALRGEVFAAVYSFSKTDVTAHVSPRLTTVAQLSEICEVRPHVVVGDGAATLADEILAWTGKEPLVAPWGIPRASSLLSLRFLQGGSRPVDSLADLEPTYGRQASAEAALKRKITSSWEDVAEPAG